MTRQHSENLQWHGLPARVRRYSVALVGTPAKSDRAQRPAIVSLSRCALVDFDRNTDRTSRRTMTHGRAARATDRRGFSFTEILFAVMILGIGFIMVAAVFPVAIKQTEETVEETTAASVVKGGAGYMGHIGVANSLATIFPPTAGKLVPFTGGSTATASFWQLLSGNLILPSDNRFAWVPFYNRGVLPSGKPAPYAQITMIAVQCRNAASFTAKALAGNEAAGGTIPNLQGRALMGVFTNNHGTAPDTVSFSPDLTLPSPASPTQPNYTGAVAEGCYLIIGDDQNLPLLKQASITINGYVFRVGNNAGGNTWELMPGGDMQNGRYSPSTTVTSVNPLQTATTAVGVPSPSVRVFIVGRGYANPELPSNTSMAGPAMDIGTFSSFIWIH